MKKRGWMDLNHRPSGCPDALAATSKLAARLSYTPKYAGKDLNLRPVSLAADRSNTELPARRLPPRTVANPENASFAFE
jgi:hypothetical protein